ncbi:MAG: LacI family DNA-binding transcriptional regulator [Alphaproteobacteria bacterium]|nr:LacI family DNA-binding transcriptional regulator [Alphaproteobacteria bacterium]
MTIHDVARHAGVSRMTVSRVINGEKSVKAATRSIVDAAIRELNYAPNPAARTLAGGAIMRIGLLYRIPNPAYLTEFLVGALDRCSEINAQLIVQRHERGADEEQAADQLIAKNLHGVILPPPLGDNPALIARLRDAGVAVVATGSTRPAPALASIGIDDFGAAREMTRHLIGLGHRRIGFITGRSNHASSGLRLDGYRQALAEAGLPAEDGLVADGNFTYHSGLDAAEQLLSRDPMPTAIFASNDDMAAATIAAAHRHRLDVPADLSVAGFDDTPLATTIWPELTTIRQPVSEMSREAVTIVAGLIRRQRDGDSTETPHRLLDFELIRRQSDAPPRRS